MYGGFNLRLLVIIILGLALLSGCTTNYTLSLLESAAREARLIDHHSVDRRHPWVLSRSNRIYIGHINHLSLKRPYRYQLMQSLKRVVGIEFTEVDMASQPTSPREALMLARQQGSDFMLYPKVTRFENNASSFTELSEDEIGWSDLGRDQLVYMISLYDVNSGEMLETTRIQTHSGFWSTGRRTPLQLSDASLSQYMSSLVAPAIP